ncbi:transporter [Persicobacter diffluens]|uniref:Transporter n=1 Tax=Persicobacter diffluens TaxID=981 RepID=A0AAN4W0B2_9BACT|nr:hypothetical protein PEDI_38730 [Persicobacter diffluens]
MRTFTIIIGLIIALVSVSKAQGLETGHYGYAINGMRSAHAPAPGFSLTNISHIYNASQMRMENGEVHEMGKSVMAFANITLLTYVHDKPVLGGKYFAAAGVPIANLALNPSNFSLNGQQAGIGDMIVFPAALSWTFDRMALTARIGFFAPTGRYKAGASNNLGKGYFSHFYTFNTP